jgi:metal-dependent amidase/aminoacylase/carboxypeptidase family protein
VAIVAGLKQQACAYIDAHLDEIIQLAKTVWDNPEPGYRETSTR